MSMMQPSDRWIEIHQLEGFDPHVRAFNRNIEIHRIQDGFQATFRYEGFSADSASFLKIQDAIGDLVSRLHQKQFRKIRSRVNFKGTRYLAERRPWTDYPDP